MTVGTSSELTNHDLKQSVNEKLPITYKYAQFGIWAQTVMISPLYGFSIYYSITSEALTLTLIFADLSAIFIGAMNLRSLFRLTETIIVTKDEIVKKTPLGNTHILQSDISRIKLYNSWLERHCYKVESVGGDCITVSEMLDGYEKLYKTLKDNVPSSKFVK